MHLNLNKISSKKNHEKIFLLFFELLILLSFVLAASTKLTIALNHQTIFKILPLLTLNRITFATTLPPDPAVFVSNITPNSVNISWTAGANTDYIVLRVGTDQTKVNSGCPLGVGPGTGCIIKIDYLGTTSSINITDLSPNTTYYYRVAAIGITPGTYSKGTNGNFKTTNISDACSATAPTNLSESNKTSNSVLLKWTPGIDGTKQVLIVGTNENAVTSGCPDGVTPNSGCIIKEDNLSITTNQYEIDFLLIPNTTYYWRIVNINSNIPNCYKDAIRNFITANVTKSVPPIPYSQIKSVEFPGPPHRPFLNFNESEFRQEIERVKNAGFNTVWLVSFWKDFEDPAGHYNQTTFANLKKALQILKDNNMYALLPLNYLGGIWPSGYSNNQDLFVFDNKFWQGFEKYVDYYSKQTAEYSNVLYIFFDEDIDICLSGSGCYNGNAIDSSISSDFRSWLKAKNLAAGRNADDISYWNQRWETNFDSINNALPPLYRFIGDTRSSNYNNNYRSDKEKWISSIIRKRFLSLPEIIKKNNPKAVVGFHDYFLIFNPYDGTENLPTTDLPVPPSNNVFDFMSFNRYPNGSNELTNKNSFHGVLNNIYNTYIKHYGRGPDIIGETGACSSSFSDNDIAAFYENLLPYLKQKNLGFSFWQWRDPLKVWWEPCQSSFGLIDLNNNPKPQYKTISTYLRGCYALPFKSGSISPSSVKPGENYTMQCDYGAVVDSIFSKPGSGSCVYSGFSSTTAKFSCTASSTTGIFKNYCVVGGGYSFNTCAQINEINNLTVLDTISPSAPQNLIAAAISPSQINLSWAASTDNVGVVGYKVERCEGSNCINFIQIATSTTTNYSDTNLSSNTTYRYRVRAFDADNNTSPYSSIVSATTYIVTENSKNIENNNFSIPTPLSDITQIQVKIFSAQKNLLELFTLIKTNPSNPDIPSKLIALAQEISKILAEIQNFKPKFAFTRNLYLGTRGEDVKKLQEFLAKDKSIYPEGIISGYYGPLTQKAVQKFQCKYNIVCFDSPKLNSYGVVDSKTRAKLNELIK